ncbi:Ribonuclease TUDOR 2 [Lathyrus oleraceus]|uniref:Ribonuclease TUDOR 2 n=1 Tax=Pisum sativum TaxID=3888 RepID=A0A9D4WNF2_PEA|nr:Ribonuclease TUDOR 2 [Pisum sativum]
MGSHFRSESEGPINGKRVALESVVELERLAQIILEGVDKFNNLIGSMYYPDGKSAKDLALKFVENVRSSLMCENMMEEEAKRRLKTTKLQAKKSRLKLWTSYVPPPTNSEVIHGQNFTGKVVEVVSGDCIVVADDFTLYGSPLAE